MSFAENAEEVLALGSALVLAGYLSTAEETLDYFTKPWKFEPLHEAWLALGRPGPEDGQPGWPHPPVANLAWERFCAQALAV